MVATLKGVGDNFGKTGTVSLKEIFRTGSGQTLNSGWTGYRMYDRISDNTATEYYTVNPFAVEAGTAPDPAGEPFGSSSLKAWDGYLHWSEADAKSTNFDLTSVVANTANFSWTRAAGYTRNIYTLRQFIYIAPCTDALTCADYQASGSAGFFTYGVGDNTSGAATGLNYNTYYVATVVTHWKEDGRSVSVGTNERESQTASTKATLSNGTKNTYDQIYFVTGTTTTTSTTAACTDPQGTSRGSNQDCLDFEVPCTTCCPDYPAGGALKCYSAPAACPTTTTTTTTSTTTTIVVPPNAPGSFSVTAASCPTDDEINLSWTDTNSNETYYQIQRTGGSCYDNTGLLPTTTYCYRVAACNGAGCGPYTSNLSATTPDCGGGPPLLCLHPEMMVKVLRD